MVLMIAKKEMAKEAWDMITTMRISDDHVKKATAQQLHWKFKLAMFDDGETIEDYVCCRSNRAVEGGVRGSADIVAAGQEAVPHRGGVGHAEEEV
jgi:hypothetical protein